MSTHYYCPICYTETDVNNKPLEKELTALRVVAEAAERFKYTWETPCLACDEGVKSAECTCTDVTEYREQLFSALAEWRKLTGKGGDYGS